MAEEKSTSEKPEEVEAKPVEKASSGSSDSSLDSYAVASLIFGIIGMFSFCFSICCTPFSIIGLVLGYMGRESKNKSGLATIGMILSALGLLIAVCSFMASFVFGWVDYSSYYDLN